MFLHRYPGHSIRDTIRNGHEVSAQMGAIGCAARQAINRKSSITVGISPPARLTEPSRASGIGRASGAKNQPIARDQGRRPAAHHWAIPRHGDGPGKAQYLGVVQGCRDKVAVTGARSRHQGTSMRGSLIIGERVRREA